MFKKFKVQVKILIESLKKSSKRFPETLILAVAVVVTGIIANHTDYQYVEKLDTLEKILLALVIGLPLFSFIKLIVEKYEFKLSLRIVIDLIIAGCLVLYYLIIPETINGEFMIKYFMISACLYLIFTLVPYYYKREKYPQYILKLGINLFITLLYSLVLYLGIIAIIFTVEKLFELSINNDIYFDVFIMIAGLFSVTYFLGNVPKIDWELEDDYYPQVLKILFLYIVSPLMSVYTLILYSYFIRILIMREFPINILSNLVVWYGLLGVMLMFFIRKIKDSNEFTKKFYKYFPIAIMIPILMMFTAIGSRILDFGITPPRYLVVITGLWILINMVYILRDKNYKSSIAVILAIIVLVVSSYGPVSAFNLSERNQNNRFESLLTELNMLDNGNIIPRMDLDDNQEKYINEFVQYFERNHSFEDARVLPEGFEIKDMKDVFGFEYTYYYPMMVKDKSYFYEHEPIMVEIVGYDYLLDVNLNVNDEFVSETEEVAIKYNAVNRVLDVISSGKKVASVDIFKFMEDYDESRNGLEPTSLDDVTVVMEFDKVELVFILESLYYQYRDNTDEVEYGYLNFKMLIKLK